MLRELFLGFLVLRLLALCALLAAGAVLLGISAFTRGSTAVGVVLLIAAALFATAGGWLVRQRNAASASADADHRQ
jgi:hypothetical protein